MENTIKEIPAIFDKDNRKALDAIGHAQFIAFAPYIWEATKLLQEKGILNIVEKANATGITIEEVAEQTEISLYGVRILLEAGLGIGLVYRKSGDYYLTKTGHFFLNNQSIVVNYNFMRDVCANGANTLEESIETSKPKGLQTLGNWNTLYEGLYQFPEPAKTSWFDFDHFYSDNSFDGILPIVFNGNPFSILDIGGNTGKWTLKCLEYNDAVKLGIVDLAGQLRVAIKNIEEAGYANRFTPYEIDVLVPENKLPIGYDIIWMSQFLDCFSDDQIVSILNKCYDASDENTRILINETFWDCQKYETSAFALQMTSLYFTTMANGNSQMYDSKVFFKFIEKAGFEIINQYNLIGYGHTLLELKKK